MKLKPEQLKEVQDSLEEALEFMLPRFVGDDPQAKYTSAMEASIGHADFPDGRTASITIRVEIETGGAEHEEKNS